MPLHFGSYSSYLDERGEPELAIWGCASHFCLSEWPISLGFWTGQSSNQWKKLQVDVHHAFRGYDTPLLMRQLLQFLIRASEHASE
jgi:hypothetical protein